MSSTSDSESGQGHRSVGYVALGGQGHRLYDDEPHSPILPLEEASSSGDDPDAIASDGPLAMVANDGHLAALSHTVPEETQPAPVPDDTEIDPDDTEIDLGDEYVISRAQVQQDLQGLRDTAGTWLAVIPVGERYHLVTLTVQNVVCECVVALIRGASDMDLAAACYVVGALWMDAKDMMQKMGLIVEDENDIHTRYSNMRY